MLQMLHDFLFDGWTGCRLHPPFVSAALQPCTLLPSLAGQHFHRQLLPSLFFSGTRLKNCRATMRSALSFNNLVIKQGYQWMDLLNKTTSTLDITADSTQPNNCCFSLIRVDWQQSFSTSSDGPWFSSETTRTRASGIRTQAWKMYHRE